MDKKQFRAIGHHLKPVVTIAGAGLTENVLAEINRALSDHELIKIKIAVDDRKTRLELVGTACKETQSETVQTIGKVALILRKNSKPNPKTSNLVRYLSKL